MLLSTWPLTFLRRGYGEGKRLNNYNGISKTKEGKSILVQQLQRGKIIFSVFTTLCASQYIWKYKFKVRRTRNNRFITALDFPQSGLKVHDIAFSHLGICLLSSSSSRSIAFLLRYSYKIVYLAWEWQGGRGLKCRDERRRKASVYKCESDLTSPRPRDSETILRGQLSTRQICPCTCFQQQRLYCSGRWAPSPPLDKATLTTGVSGICVGTLLQHRARWLYSLGEAIKESICFSAHVGVSFVW